MRIQHNIPALNAHRNLTNNNSAVSKNLEKLSSGYRINRAGDDAAGLAISEKMRAQITGLQTAQKNAEDGVSLVQTAEGALTEVHSMLNRMVELATQSANGTYSTSNREEMQKEINALNEEIDRISQTSNFNGTKLFQGGGGTGGAAGVPDITGLELTDTAATKYSGTAAALTAPAAPLTAGQTVSLSVNYTDANGKTDKVDITLTYDGSNLVGEDGTVYTAAKPAEPTAAELGDAFAKAINNNAQLKDVFKVTAATGALTFEAKVAGSTTTLNKLEQSTAGAAAVDKAVTKAANTGTDAFQSFNFANYTLGDVFTVDGKKFAIVADQAAAVALGPDVNAVVGDKNAAGVSALKDLIEQKTGYAAEIDGTTTTQLNFKAPAGAAGGAAGGSVNIALHVGESSSDANTINVNIKAMSASSLGVKGIDITTVAGAKNAIDTVNAAIDDVSSIRSDLGALQNRLEHTINNLGVQTENITAAESRIRDVDMAKEMMAYTKNNILVQASQAMLAQANQIPQGVLQLLQ